MELYKIREELKYRNISDIPLKVTFYARVSTDKYEQLNSLDNQINFFKDMIIENDNWTYVEGYIDEGISATSTEKRQSFLQMIEDGKNKKFDLILTKEVSRFARDTLDSIANTRFLLKHGVGVQFLNDGINTLMPDSELRLTIMSSLAQDEVRKLSERVKFGHQRSIKSGRVLGNNDIWGYEKKDGKLVIVEEEAEMIKRLFELYTTGKYGLNTVARMLYKEGFKNKNGNKLSMTTIGNIIRNPKYKGYYCGNKSTVVDYKLKTIAKRDKKDWSIYKDNKNVPPIVSEEIWTLAQLIYDKRSSKVKNVDKRIYQSRYLFSGKIKCENHIKSFHRKVYHYKTKDDEIVWLCPFNNGLKEEKCNTPVLYEKELLSILKERISDFINKKESVIYSLIELYKENICLRDFNKEINKKQSDIESIIRKKDKLLSHNVNGIISDKEFMERNNNCNDMIRLLENNIENIKQEQVKVNNLEVEVMKLEQLIKNSLSKPSDDLIIDLLDKIIVYYSVEEHKTKLKIYLKIGKEILTDYKKDKSHHFYCSHAHDKSRC